MRITPIGAVLLLLTLTGACTNATPAAAVDDALTQVVVGNDLPGGIVVVGDGTGLTRAAAGHSDVDTKPGFAPNTHVRAASITKTFVAATILQLVAEGKVDLDAPIETYLPAASAGRASTPMPLPSASFYDTRAACPSTSTVTPRCPPKPLQPISLWTLR